MAPPSETHRMPGTRCDRCGDESDSTPGLLCGRMVHPSGDDDHPDAAACTGIYRDMPTPPNVTSDNGRTAMTTNGTSGDHHRPATQRWDVQIDVHGDADVRHIVRTATAALVSLLQTNGVPADVTAFDGNGDAFDSWTTYTSDAMLIQQLREFLTEEYPDHTPVGVLFEPGAEDDNGSYFGSDGTVLFTGDHIADVTFDDAIEEALQERWPNVGRDGRVAVDMRGEGTVTFAHTDRDIRDWFPTTQPT